MVFLDNLYMYGPQTEPLVETMPLTATGWKPGARSATTRIWMDAAKGEALITALRAPDFYGPGVGNSFLGDTSIGKFAEGKPAVFVGSPDVLHDYAYVPDIARAATTLLPRPTRPSVRPGTFPAPRPGPRAISSQSQPRRSV
jgi:nucleoside-diphosphate-sugar epimerase